MDNRTRTEPDQRITQLATSAISAMTAIDAHRVPFDGEVKMYVSPKTGRRYVTIVGFANGRPFGEVFAQAATGVTWDETIKALVELEG